MRILMVLEREFPSDERVEKEIKSLLNEGHKVHLVCYTFQGKAKKEEYNGYTIYRKPVSKFIYKSSVGALKFPFYFNFWREYIERLFQKEPYDVIHIHDLPLAKLGVEMKKKYGISLVIDLHENWPALLEISKHTNTLLGRVLSSTKQWEQYEIKSLEYADIVITVIEEMKERLIKLGIPENNIAVITNAVDIERFKLPNMVSDKEFITLFYAGGINYHRGLHIAIEGLKIISEKQNNVRLWILGKGKYETKLKRLVSSYHLDDFVEFMGWKTTEEVAHFLMKSDIGLIPHIKSEHTDNTIPNKIFQYLYAGKPVLSSNCIPLKRILHETTGGLVYEHNSAEDFAEKFFLLVENKNYQVKEKLTQYILQKYNWKHEEKKLVSVYSKFIQKRKYN